MILTLFFTFSAQASPAETSSALGATVTHNLFGHGRVRGKVHIGIGGEYGNGRQRKYYQRKDYERNDYGNDYDDEDDYDNDDDDYGRKDEYGDYYGKQCQGSSQWPCRQDEDGYRGNGQWRCDPNPNQQFPCRNQDGTPYNPQQPQIPPGWPPLPFPSQQFPQQFPPQPIPSQQFPPQTNPQFPQPNTPQPFPAQIDTSTSTTLATPTLSAQQIVSGEPGLDVSYLAATLWLLVQ